MITKFEVQKVKKALEDFVPEGRTGIIVPGVRITMMLDKYVARELTRYVTAHRQAYGLTQWQLGKSKYLHLLLKQFAKDQPAVLQLMDINPDNFNKSVLVGIQDFKHVCRDYIDTSITTQSKAVLALLVYSSTRSYEVKNGLPVTGVIDHEYEDDIEELKLSPNTDNVYQLLKKARDEGLKLEVT